MVALDPSVDCGSEDDDPKQCMSFHSHLLQICPSLVGKCMLASAPTWLRLSKVLTLEGNFLLDVGNNNGLEVHNERLRRENANDKIFVAAFHPNNEDVIVLHHRDIY
ncbi:hypothetical protein TorRG33x02_108740 [Trema orientale]|uniref:Uncharacterized protein n=1 Tax=Trema orientale TaxID=63057 RepID=A0A2P5F679_TREOI|nr:hypothetical protein TorRG33x02_108740 [Trema orientale]